MAKKQKPEPITLAVVIDAQNPGDLSGAIARLENWGNKFPVEISPLSVVLHVNTGRKDLYEICVHHAPDSLAANLKALQNRPMREGFEAAPVLALNKVLLRSIKKRIPLDGFLLQAGNLRDSQSVAPLLTPSFIRDMTGIDGIPAAIAINRQTRPTKRDYNAFEVLTKSTGMSRHIFYDPDSNMTDFITGMVLAMRGKFHARGAITPEIGEWERNEIHPIADDLRARHVANLELAARWAKWKRNRRIKRLAAAAGALIITFASVLSLKDKSEIKTGMPKTKIAESLPATPTPKVETSQLPHVTAVPAPAPTQIVQAPEPAPIDHLQEFKNKGVLEISDNNMPLFESGLSNITARFQTVVESVGAEILANPEKCRALTITGYADREGNPERNITLTKNRAEALKTMLLRIFAETRRNAPRGSGFIGIPEARIITIGRGSQDANPNANTPAELASDRTAKIQCLNN